MLGRDRRVDKCFTVVTLDENDPDLLPSKRNKGMIDAVIAGKKGLFNKGLGPGIGWAMVKCQQRHGFSQSHFIHKHMKDGEITSLQYTGNNGVYGWELHYGKPTSHAPPCA